MRGKLFWIRLLFHFVLSVFIWTTACAESIRRDFRVSLERIDPQDGKTVWSVEFDPLILPYRCEAYPNRIVTFLYSRKEGLEADKTQVVFLNSQTGKPVTPFDTRQFIWPKQDPLITRSRHGSRGSVDDERGELLLPNGWRSRGVAGLSWRNAGKNNIYFFRGSKMEWSMILPEGAYNLANWKDILIYNRYTQEPKRITDTLYAQPAGNDSTIWSFTLPKDIPDRPGGGSDFITDETLRNFTYAVGKDYIFTFGGGTLFVLEPKSGKVLSRHKISDDALIKKDGVRIEMAEIIEGEGQLFLVSEKVLVRFDLGSKSVAAVLRKDLHDGPLPIVVGEALYCFTQHP